MEDNLKRNIKSVIYNIYTTCNRIKRDPSAIKLVIVTKGQSLSAIQQVFKIWEEEISLSSNLYWPKELIFGESYLKEYKEKFLNDLNQQPSDFPLKSKIPFSVHMIGHVQSNKVKDCISYFDCIESINSQKIISMLDKEAKKANIKKKIFLQMNISKDPLKKGFMEEDVSNIVKLCLQEHTNLQICGLMTITKDYENLEEVRKDYRKMRILKDQLLVSYPTINQGGDFELSMGMSSDYIIAIEEGATLVRIGSAIFDQFVLPK